MEYKYYRELKHNYLIVKNEEPELRKGVSYQTRMLERGNLTGFLPCNLRTINGEAYLYYEINSMQSLKDRFAVKGMSASELRALLSALRNSLEILSDYLLGMENVVLDGRSVFVDLATSEYRFMYCPFKTEQADFKSFVDELFELVDHEDEAAVEMIYSCSEKMQIESTLVMDVIEQVLNEESVDQDEQETYRMQANTQELEDFREDFFPEDIGDENNDIQKEEAKSKKNKLDGRIQILFGVLFMGLLGAMMYIRMNYILSKEEDILSIIVIVLSMITGLIALLTGIKDITENGVSRFRTKKVEKTGDDEDDYYGYDMETSYDNDFMSEDAYMNEAGYRKQVKITAANSSVKKAPATCGETIVLTDEDDTDKDIILYSRNSDKTIRISLDKLPLTVGKMEGCVDKVINDVSISRMHCRFVRDREGRPAVVDLGSTNGTYRNGLRLNPQEECSIDEGDEIRIGKICFDCR
ncbi:MAG: FHA domain-containing protein [Butyrivibrio sp.]|uniref:DUF6382 domain-containing protein n=1 Tax=Butyrivibrio sp. TaxID=28121 RepID=UPI0025BFDE75|nr:DUF6382 domain-containing protein [Butyrivibrio sp.]MBQ6589684.1 FHA domain-containing protein [Butyrivibrio sp.]